MSVEVWVVDVPQQKHITTLLKYVLLVLFQSYDFVLSKFRWLKRSGLDGPELGHLKRIRKHKDSVTTTLLLCPSSIAEPEPPSELELPPPYIISVPSSSALTPTSLALKSSLWPTMFTPRRKDEPERWTRGKLRWAWDAMQRTLTAASRAHFEGAEVCKFIVSYGISFRILFGQLPIGALIPEPFKKDASVSEEGLSFTAADTRHSTNHPLRHAAINVVRQLADYRASHDCSTMNAPDTMPATHDTEADCSPEGEESKNGSNYLLTDRTFFISHEPCIMCSMALLHSRVKEVVYMFPMPQTGGCGGSTCLPILKGVNHRFAILQWKLDHPSAEGLVEKALKLDGTVDA